MIQEAVGFEPGSPIEADLQKHGFVVKYFQKGDAPPLAVLAKGATREQLESVRHETDVRTGGHYSGGQWVSGTQVRPDLECTIIVRAADTIPWGGTDAFYERNARHQAEQPGNIPSAPSPETKKGWAATYLTAFVRHSTTLVRIGPSRWRGSSKVDTLRTSPLKM